LKQNVPNWAKIEVQNTKSEGVCFRAEAKPKEQDTYEDKREKTEGG
jgi:hypothetical protein